MSSFIVSRILFTKTRKLISSRNSQTFDIEYLLQILNSPCVCSNNAHLEFIANTSLSVELYHQNGLHCTKSEKGTTLTNFAPTYPIEATQQEPNRCLTVAVVATEFDYDARKTIMSTLPLSVMSEKPLLHQFHKY